MTCLLISMRISCRWRHHESKHQGLSRKEILKWASLPRRIMNKVAKLISNDIKIFLHIMSPSILKVGHPRFRHLQIPVRRNAWRKVIKIKIYVTNRKTYLESRWRSTRNLWRKWSQRPRISTRLRAWSNCIRNIICVWKSTNMLSTSKINTGTFLRVTSI